MQTEDHAPLRPVLTLTEEELLVLTDGDLGVVPPRLHLPEDQECAALVRAVAVRTLMARGLVLPGGAAGDEVPWEATEPLGLTLTVRDLAPAVLGLQRVLGPHEDEAAPAGQPEPTVAVRYLHLHADVAVIEDVTPDGMHSLLTVFPDRYQEAVGDFIRPPEAVPGEGPVRTLGARADGPADADRPADADGAPDPEHEAVAELLAALGHPTVLVEAAVLRGLGEGPPEEPARQMLALGPGGTFRSWDSRTYHPVDPDHAISELLAEALGEGGQ